MLLPLLDVTTASPHLHFARCSFNWTKTVELHFFACWTCLLCAFTLFTFQPMNALLFLCKTFKTSGCCSSPFSSYIRSLPFISLCTSSSPRQNQKENIAPCLIILCAWLLECKTKRDQTAAFSSSTVHTNSFFSQLNHYASLLFKLLAALQVWLLLLHGEPPSCCSPCCHVREALSP
ncbi:hypothetical protein VIGAN_11026300 [Vigna angularis var. angularis]|uniref:Uncharacterized protein n=1 Tax=Vigna angularis var. angularis TaxID=157739 RepID=A0A0S3T883_PHAAN|nr:hypothetical protein VIGAN_11026300 [Vigna angularis var. angularis]